MPSVPTSVSSYAIGISGSWLALVSGCTLLADAALTPRGLLVVVVVVMVVVTVVKELLISHPFY